MTFWSNRSWKVSSGLAGKLAHRSMKELHSEWKTQHHSPTAPLHRDSQAGFNFQLITSTALYLETKRRLRGKSHLTEYSASLFNLSVRSSSPLTSRCHGVTVIQREKCSAAGNPGDRTPFRMSRPPPPPRCEILMAIEASCAAEESAGVNDVSLLTGFQHNTNQINDLMSIVLLIQPLSEHAGNPIAVISICSRSQQTLAECCVLISSSQLQRLVGKIKVTSEHRLDVGKL